MKKILAILLALYPLYGIVAQSWDNPGIRLYGGISRTLANSSRYSYTADWGYAMGVQWGKQIWGNAYWINFWNNPTFGIDISVCRNPCGVAGDRMGIQGYLEHSLWQEAPIDFHMGLGLSCYTLPYSRTHNDLNRHIGSYLNCLIDIGFLYRLPMGDESKASIGLKFLHSSNGYLKKPNNGLNYIQGEVGIAFPSHQSEPVPSSNKQSFLLDANPIFEQKDSAYDFRDIIYVSYAPSLVQSRHSLGTREHYYAYTAQMGVLHKFHPCFAYGFNVDLMFNYSHKEQFNWYKDGFGMMKIPFYIGAVGTFEIYYGPLSIRLSLGGTLLKSTLVTIPYYERVGAYYHFGERLKQFAGISLKAYGGHIDYIEWTYGIKFPLPSLDSHPQI